MSYREFREQIVPSVLELQKECSKMSEEEFNEFREGVMHEVRKQKLSTQKLSTQFMAAVLDLIHGELFTKKADTVQGVA